MQTIKLVTLLLAASLAGCSGFAQSIDALNDRQITSCVRWQGSMRAGGMLSGGHVAVQGVTATGGAELSECRAQIGQ